MSSQGRAWRDYENELMQRGQISKFGVAIETAKIALARFWKRVCDAVRDIELELQEARKFFNWRYR